MGNSNPSCCWEIFSARAFKKDKHLHGECQPTASPFWSSPAWSARKRSHNAKQANRGRSIFLAKDVSHLVLLANHVAEKRLLTLTDHHKAIIRIWMIEDTSAHYFVERFYGKIEHLLDQLKAILIDSSRPDIIAYLIADSKDLDKKVQDTQIKDTKGETRNIIVKVLTEKDVGSAKLLAERIGQLSVIHDPEGKFMHKTREV